ncbi:MAG: AMP-binding protein, partial [Acidobacteriota bacterium]
MPEQARRNERQSGTREIQPDAVLAEVRDLVAELEPKKRRGERVRLDSSLGSDLGLDSLARGELLGRLEKRFGAALPERVLTDAESPRDLLRELHRVAPAGTPRPPRPEAVAPAREEPAAPIPEEAPAAHTPEEAGTLLEALEWHAQAHPERRHVLYLEKGPGEGAEEELTYAGLRERARRAGAALQAMGLEPGQSVGLMLPTGLDYFAAFLGVQMAGGIPVSMYPPMRRSQIEDHLKRQAGIMDNARVRILVTFGDVKPLTRILKTQVPELARVVTADALDGDPEALRPVPVESRDTAFLQYTSGSTGAPKGVILTHGNLLANLRSMGEVLEVTADDAIVSWLPLYHDMGLIGAWMGSLYFGVPLVLMSPLSFLSRPGRWLWAVHHYRATLTAAPNFAYELCLAKLADEDLEGLDLSCLRVTLNGAEPVSPRAVERFPERFAPYGLHREAMMPVYGLAECSLAVSFTPPDREPVVDTIARETFQKEDRAEPADPGDEHPLRFVSCGRPIPGHEVRFVDEAGREVPDRHQGRLQFRGPSATSGYFRNPEATARLIRDDGWLDSEDLGYMAAGEIYLTGRAKDLIIRAGRNIYPQEVEDAVGTVAGVRRGCVAVFAVEEDETGTERLVVMAETRLDEGDAAGRRELVERIEAVTMDLVGTDPDDVVLVPPRTVPKTSSGKIRRSTAREMFRRGRLEAPGRSVWWQVVRLALSGLAPQLRSARRRASATLYAAWFWALFGAIAVPVWLVVWATPSRRLRRRFVRAMARSMARLTGTRVEARGLEHLDGAGAPRVITSKHASYLDGFVLAAALPPEAAYVVKAELRDNPFARVFLEKIGCVFVERFDPCLLYTFRAHETNNSISY